MTNNDMRERVEVTQADQEQAVDVLDTLLAATAPVMLSPDEAEAIIHEAFARHRIASTEAERARADKAEERLRGAVGIATQPMPDLGKRGLGSTESAVRAWKAAQFDTLARLFAEIEGEAK